MHAFLEPIHLHSRPVLLRWFWDSSFLFLPNAHFILHLDSAAECQVFSRSVSSPACHKLSAGQLLAQFKVQHAKPCKVIFKEHGTINSCPSCQANNSDVMVQVCAMKRLHVIPDTTENKSVHLASVLPDSKSHRFTVFRELNPFSDHKHLTTHIYLNEHDYQLHFAHSFRYVIEQTCCPITHSSVIHLPKHGV